MLFHAMGQEVLSLHPLSGALFESLIISEFIKSRDDQGLPVDLWFWRDNNRVEADPVFETGSKL